MQPVASIENMRLGKAQTELARLTVEADEVIRETMSCMETQRRYLERFFLGEFSVDVSWCNAHDFVKALYGAYFLNNTGDRK